MSADQRFVSRVDGSQSAILRRSWALALIGSVIALPSCHSETPIRVGSKNFAESVNVAEVYAAAIERACMSVERLMIIGDSNEVTRKLMAGEVDVYPEYEGTGYMDVLDLDRPSFGEDVLGHLRQEYRRRFRATWLNPSPASDPQALAMRRGGSIRTLSECAVAAKELRFAAPEEFFLRRRDGYWGLRAFYGGFAFKSNHPRGKLALGQQYDALLDGDADVVAVSATDAENDAAGLVILEDDRHFWPSYRITPVTRLSTLATYPTLALILEAASDSLDLDVLVRINRDAYDGRDPGEAGKAYVGSLAHFPAVKQCT